MAARTGPAAAKPATVAAPALPVLTSLSIGVTGHRDLDADDEPRLREQVRDFLLRLRQTFPGLPLRVICGLAEGADRLVAEQALALDVPVLVPRFTDAKDSDESETETGQSRRFQSLLERCRSLDLSHSTNPLRSSREAGSTDAGHERDARLGVFISSHCQILLALWDGQTAQSPGETGDIVEFHLNERMPALNWSAPMPAQLAEDSNDLIYHLPCRRRGLDRLDASAAPRWLLAEDELPGDQPIPEEYRRVFSHMQTYNADLLRHAGSIAADAHGFFSEQNADLRTDRQMQHLDVAYRQSDWLAVHYQRQVRRGLLAIHLMAILMGAAFIAYDNVLDEPWFLGLFLLAFVVGWLWYVAGRRRDWHRKYLDYRTLAEGLRVQMYWHLARVETDSDILFAYDAFLRNQDAELGWIRHVMRDAALVQDRRHSRDPHWLSWTIADWVGDETSGQLGYYLRKCHQCELHYGLTQRLGLLALISGVMVAALLLLLSSRLPGPVATGMLVLVGLLPLIAGVRESYSNKKADKELIKQYRHMGGIFRRARRQLDAAKSDDERRRVLRALGDACLEEHTEWLRIHRDRPLEQSQLG